LAADLFISYAWTSGQHQQWVHLLAAQLKALGYDVLVDADVDYGDSLTGFMRRVTEAAHVLLIVDTNYVDRADNFPESGVAVENTWLASVLTDRPSDWLTALFKDNDNSRLPQWLTEHKPKGHWFNADADAGDFPGSEQIEDLWRWVEGLPPNRDHAVPISRLRERSTRLERQASKTDPTQWRSPSLQGETHFPFLDAPGHMFRWGYGDSEFALNVSGCGDDSIYVYKDSIQAVGVVRGSGTSVAELEAYLIPGRTVVAKVGQTVVLMNKDGMLSVVEIVGVQRESTGSPYVAPYVDFTWRVIEES